MQLIDVTNNRALNAQQIDACLRELAGRIRDLAQGSDVAAVLIAVDHGLHLAIAQLTCATHGWLFCPLGIHDAEAAKLAVLHQFENSATRATICTTSVDVEAAVQRALMSTTELLGEDASRPAVASLRWPADTDVSRLMYTIGTSGSTTGTPRLVEVAVSQLLAYVRALNAALGVTGASTLLLVSGPTFDPSIGDVFCAWVAGCTLATAAYAHILSDIGDALCRAKPTHVVASPALWRHVDAARLVQHSAHQLTVALGGERMSTALRLAWAPRVRLANVYGVTEAVGYQAITWIDATAPAEDVPDVGVPIGENVISLEPFKDEDASELDFAGQPMELIIRGPQVTNGYWQGRRFGDTYRSGDVAVAHPREGIKLVGRRDFQVKVDGRRVSVEEVERTLLEAPHVAQWLETCVCLAVNVPRLNRIAGTTVRLVVVGAVRETVRTANGDVHAAFPSAIEHPATSMYARAIALLSRCVLTQAQQPSVCLQWAGSARTLPTTSNGKLDRRAVAAWAARDFCGSARGDAAVQNILTAEERVVADVVLSVWSALFNCRVNLSTNFWTAGGDSLLALKASHLITERLTVAQSGLRFRDVRESPNSIESLSLALGTDVPITITGYGEVRGPTGPQFVMQYPVLRDFVDHLIRSGVAAGAAVMELTAHARNEETLKVASLPPEVSADGAVTGTDKHEDDQQLLQAAVLAGDVGLLATLLDACHIDISAGTSRAAQRTSVLHLAVAGGNVAVVDLLVAHGSKLTAFDKHHVTPAHLAAQRSLPCLQRLLSAGVPAAIRDGRDQGLLHHAARTGNAEVLQYLLDVADLSPLKRDRWQRTPLHWAALNGHLAACRVLVEAILNLPGGPPVRKKALTERLARGKTHLPYESPRAIATRVHGVDSEIYTVCDQVGDDV
jgi:acyl-CoA synthetase (AMP-forming)/AMP-acid ligase II